MGLIYFEYRNLRSYRQTYHPPEEIRLQREIDRLKADDSPFGFKKIPHISRNALFRIVEQITTQWGLPHPRLLGPDHFKISLPGWRAQCQGLYKYYREIRPAEQSEGRIVDFMLDHLGFERLDELPLKDQVVLLRTRFQRINWDFVSKPIKYYLVFRLAEEAGVVHPRFLTSDHFKVFEIDELGSTLIGLHDNYAKRIGDPGRIIEALLNDAGVPSIESLPREIQLRGLKERDLIKWEVIPASTQLRLLEMARQRMPEHNGLKCPHLRFLIVDELKVQILDEIGVALGGLHDYYRRRVPEGYRGTSADYMLDQLGVEKFADLSYEKQCECLRYDNNWRWADIPEALAIHLLERVREINNLPHLRFINREQLGQTTIPEIDSTLERMYQHFMIASRPDDKRQIADQILDHYNIPPFSAMPFRLQIGWTHRNRGKLTSWRRVPDAVIGHYLFGAMKAAGIKNPFNLQEKHFRQQVMAKGTGLAGLYNYLGDVWPGSGSESRMLDWAIERFGLGLKLGIEAKRRAGARLLAPNERALLIQLAQLGDRDAFDHLIFFYEKLIASIAYRVISRFPFGRLTPDELIQEGRYELARIIELHDPLLGDFGTYVNKTLPLRLRNAIIRKYSSPREISLFAPVDREGDLTREDLIESPSAVRPDELAMDLNRKNILEAAIEGSGLTDNEKYALRQYWLEGHTLEEVGEKMGLSRERVRQLQKSALKKISASRRGKILKELL